METVNDWFNIGKETFPKRLVYFIWDIWGGLLICLGSWHALFMTRVHICHIEHYPVVVPSQHQHQHNHHSNNNDYDNKDDDGSNRTTPTEIEQQSASESIRNIDSQKERTINHERRTTTRTAKTKQSDTSP